MNFQLLQSQTVTSSNVSTVSPIFNVNMGTLGNTQAAGTLWTISTQYASKFSKFSSQQKHIDDIGNSRSSGNFRKSLRNSQIFKRLMQVCRII